MRRILLIDDHEVVREGLKKICRRKMAEVEFGEAGSEPEAIRMAETERWDLAILDISLGSRSGLEVLTRLRVIQPRMPVLMLSMHSESLYARRAMVGGASGYMRKDMPQAELAKAIDIILKGGRYISSAMTDALLMDLCRDADGTQLEALSNRELEVVMLIAQGKPLSEIATLLHLSDKTISTYRARVLEKLNMRSNAELTRFVIENKLEE